MQDDLRDFSDRLGYGFRDPSLLDRALTHSSCLEDGSQSNERLEFLGDAVLSLVVSGALYRRFPTLSEGQLTKLKAHFVRERQLAAAARVLGVDSFLRLGKGEEANGGRAKDRILADALEAVLGALYLDGGIEVVQRVIDRAILGDEHRIREAQRTLYRENSKSELQEWLQARGRPLPEYVVLRTVGPPQRRTYVVEVRCGASSTAGEGTTKKAAEKNAALHMLDRLRADTEWVPDGLMGDAEGTVR